MLDNHSLVINLSVIYSKLINAYWIINGANFEHCFECFDIIFLYISEFTK